ncbi:MAG TPA: dihydrolipoyl dehydrogenase [Elusimicrobia bacterium]|nr:MAG: dihydrolipoyl dehydrogenase [Elusimicrobia bacterium GWA2_66_18]HAZ07600.1 dihydrolipoyl dehydrogenase [Elusimicrobiota bacterium]
MSIKTDVLIIGGGPGGYVAAIKLGQLGKKALVVDCNKLGGECLNYGCIPSKALIHAAGTMHKSKKSKDAGFDDPIHRIDWEKVVTWKDQMIGGFVKNIGVLIKGNKGDVLFGLARFTSEHTAVVEKPDGATETVEFEQAIVATGSEPFSIPGFAVDGKFVLGSKESLELNKVPEGLVVIGGGVIGLEIGTIFAKLGTKVTVVEFTDSILPVIEGDLAMPVRRSLAKLGVEILTSSRAKSWSMKGKRLEVIVETPEGKREISCDKVLLAVGRAPRTKDLGLDALGVELDKHGHIAVDTEMLSSVDNIYAIGDAVGQPYLAHKASREAVLAAQSIAGKPLEPRGHVPWAVFTDPEISWVGLTDAQAKAEGYHTVMGKFPFAASGRAQAVRETEGFCKIVADKDTHRILGAGFVGPNASDLIGEACLAVSMGATLEQVSATIHPHPTLNETFAEACEVALGHPIHTLAVTRSAPSFAA